jgi:hypothetical protein
VEKGLETTLEDAPPFIQFPQDSMLPLGDGPEVASPRPRNPANKNTPRITKTLEAPPARGFALIQTLAQLSYTLFETAVDRRIIVAGGVTSSGGISADALDGGTAIADSELLIPDPDGRGAAATGQSTRLEG